MARGAWWRGVIGRGPRRLIEAELVDLGVHGPVAPTWVERPADAEIESALATDRPVVVVIGPALAGKTHSLARAARRLLGDHALTRRTRDETDLADLVARTEAPGVVWLDDCPPLLLEQITSELVAGLPVGVRLLVTAHERRFPPVFADPGTCALLWAPESLVRLDPLAEAAAAVMTPALEEVRAAVVARTSAERAVLAATWDSVLIGWPGPLPAPLLVAVAGEGLWGGARTAAATLAGLRRLRAAGHPLIRWTGREAGARAWPHPLAVALAERADRIPSFDPWTVALRRLDPAQRAAIGRTLLARVGRTVAGPRGEVDHRTEELASWIGWLVRDADLQVLPPDRAMELGKATRDHGPARRLHGRALDDPGLAHEARFALGEIEESAGRYAEAAEHLREIADHTRAVIALARLAEKSGDTAQARHWHEETLRRGHQDARERAFRALARLVERDDLTSMRRWFIAALEAGAVAPGFVRGAWAAAELRVGDPARARVLLESAEGWPDRLLLNAAAHLLDGDANGALAVMGGPARYGGDYGGMIGLLKLLLSKEAWRPAAVALVRDPAYPDLERGMRFWHLVEGFSAENSHDNSDARYHYRSVLEDDRDEDDALPVIAALAHYGLARQHAVFDERDVVARRSYDHLRADARPEIRAMGQRFWDDYGHLLARR